MKRVFLSPNHAEAGLLQSLLEAEGIHCSAKNMQYVMVPGTAFPELWVNDDDEARATQLVRRWHERPEENLESWVCHHCGAENEAQFGACWECGEPLSVDAGA